MRKIIVCPGDVLIKGMDYNLRGLDRLAGFIEEWYSGGEGYPQGMMISDEKLEVASFLHSFGVPTSPEYSYGVYLQDKMYDSKTALIEGAIVTYSDKKEFFGAENIEEACKFNFGQPIRVSEKMPKGIVSIFAENEDRVFDAAKKLRLG